MTNKQNLAAALGGMPPATGAAASPLTGQPQVPQLAPELIPQLTPPPAKRTIYDEIVEGIRSFGESYAGKPELSLQRREEREEKELARLAGNERIRRKTFYEDALRGDQFLKQNRPDLLNQLLENRLEAADLYRADGVDFRDTERLYELSQIAVSGGPESAEAMEKLQMELGNIVDFGLSTGELSQEGYRTMLRQNRADSDEWRKKNADAIVAINAQLQKGNLKNVWELTERALADADNYPGADTADLDLIMMMLRTRGVPIETIAGHVEGLVSRDQDLGLIPKPKPITWDEVKIVPTGDGSILTLQLGENGEIVQNPIWLGVDKRKPISPDQFKYLAELNQKIGSIKEMRGLAQGVLDDIASMGPDEEYEVGIKGRIGKKWREFWGTQNTLDEAKRKYKELALNKLLDMLPPGVASDTDVRKAEATLQDSHASKAAMEKAMKTIIGVTEGLIAYEKMQADYVSRTQTLAGFQDLALTKVKNRDGKDTEYKVFDVYFFAFKRGETVNDFLALRGLVLPFGDSGRKNPMPTPAPAPAAAPAVAP